MTTNAKIASIFSNIGNMLDILGDNPFKIRAYKNASKTVQMLDVDIKEFAEEGRLTDIKGIGKDLSNKINDFIKTGRIEYYDELKSRVPEEILKIRNIQGIGPKLIQTLFNDFNVRSISDLETTLSDPDFIGLKGIGSKKINELKVGIKLFKSYINKINLGIALPSAEHLIIELLNIPCIEKAEIAGDLKRGKETVEILDIVVSTEDQKKTSEEISKLIFIKKDTLTMENGRINFTLDSGIPVRIDIANQNSFNTIKFIMTGTVKHANAISHMYDDLAIDLRNEKYPDQEEIYKRLNIQYIPPELRATIKEMAEAAKKLGYEYIAITDHSISSRIANGLDAKRLIEKRKELMEIDNSIDGIKIIFGSEVDIKPDGSLDYPDEVLKDLDMVVASIHSNFKMEEEEMTLRITKALSNPYVCALGHPTGRLIGERHPYKMDINKIIDTAKDYGKALEVNSSFMRLDLKDEHVRMAVDKGVNIIISTDAHHTDQLKQMRYGISTARRGWAEKVNVINTLSQNNLLKWLNTFK
jgi:DNA polymerase (family 10)